MNDMNEWKKSYAPAEVEESQVAIYLAKVMGWMCVGLLTTFVAALLCLTAPDFVDMLIYNRFLLYSILIIQLLVAVGMRAAVSKISPLIATVMFMVYSALMGVTLSMIGVAFQAQSVAQVFLISAAVFLSMATYGFVTKKDLTQIGGLGMAALVGIILAGLVNFFLRSSMLDLIISCVAVFAFIGLTAYDTQNIKNIYLTMRDAGYEDDSPEIRKVAIFGALTLYLDFVNLFLRLLRIMGKRR